MKTVKRQHFLSLLGNVLSLLVFLAALLFFLFKLLSYDISLSGRFLYFQIPALTLASVAALVYFIYTAGTLLSTKITADEHCLEVESRFLNLRKTVLSYKHVHMLICRQNLIERLFNVKRLQLNSGSRNAGAEIDITVDTGTAAMIESAVRAVHCKDDKPQKSLTLPAKWIALYSLLIPAKWLRPIGYTLSAAAIIVGLSVRALPLASLIGLYALSVLVSIGVNALSAVLKYRNFNITGYDCALSITYGSFEKLGYFISKEK
ncbi:MAG: PH domain-containing protein, partial [Clostridia bacterium]|nr:PH domain-containing protein [Clostridia bacterium]